METRAALAEAILNCKPLLTRYLVGFSDENHTRQAPGLPNHVAWSLGHLSLTMHRVASELDGGPLPEGDIAPGARGTGERFAAESVAFGSSPADDRSNYPALARCVAIYERACDRLAGAVTQATDEQLARTIKWGIGEVPLRSLLGRMVFHNGMHTGQIADLRRALGMGSIFA